MWCRVGKRKCPAWPTDLFARSSSTTGRTCRRARCRAPPLLGRPDSDESVPSAPSHLPGGNRLLDSLPDHERGRISDKLHEVRLQMKEPLCVAGDRTDSVISPSARSSLCSPGRKGPMASRWPRSATKDLVGVSLFWGAEALNPAEILQVQVPGVALRMDAGVFRASLPVTAGSRASCAATPRRCLASCASRSPATLFTPSRSVAPAGCF